MYMYSRYATNYIIMMSLLNGVQLVHVHVYTVYIYLYMYMYM